MKSSSLIFALLLCATLLSGCPGMTSPQKVAEANEKQLATEGITPLKADDPAPAFTALSASGEQVSIGGSTVEQTQADDTYTVLYFYPADFTPNSARNLQDVSIDLPKLEQAKVKLYGVTVTSSDDAAKFAAQYGILVPLLADDGTAAQTYGTLLPGGKYPQRTLVGIKPDGTIGFYHRGITHMHIADDILKEAGRAAAPEEKK